MLTKQMNTAAGSWYRTFCTLYAAWTRKSIWRLPRGVRSHTCTCLIKHLRTMRAFKSSIKVFMDSQQKLCFPSSDRNQSASRLVMKDEMNFAYERANIVKGIYISLCSHLLGAAFTDAQRQFPLCWAFVSRGKWKLFSNFINSASEGNSPGRLLHQNYSANVVVIVAVEDSRGCGECLKFSFRKLSVIDRRVSALKSMNTLVQPKAFIL